MARQRSAWALATVSQAFYKNDTPSGNTNKTDHTDAASAANIYLAVTGANQRTIEVHGAQGQIILQIRQNTAAGTCTFKFEGSGDDVTVANPTWATCFELSITLSTQGVIETISLPVSFQGLRAVRLAAIKSTAAPSVNNLVSANARVTANWDY